MFTIERVDSYETLAREEQRAAEATFGADRVRGLAAYRLRNGGEALLVLAPAQPDATPGAVVAGFGDQVEAGQHVEVTDGEPRTVEVRLASRLDIHDAEAS